MGVFGKFMDSIRLRDNEDDDYFLDDDYEEDEKPAKKSLFGGGSRQDDDYYDDIEEEEPPKPRFLGSSRSAKVLFPWSIWAMIEKFRICS